MKRAPWPVLAVVLLLVAATMTRIVAARQPGLWADEIFSLAMATGHSLEHPAAAADPSLGDFVEPPDAQPAQVFRRYTEYEQPTDVRRVVRAVRLSDTSPPFYYLLLQQWIREFGTGDAALRLFSVLWAVLSLPLLWLLGQEMGGNRVAWTACTLFSFSPVAMYYSVEGRMYSLLWFLVLALGWLTFQIASEGGRRWHSVLWVLAGVAGLLTHYFFAFVWLACLAWLWLSSRPSFRWHASLLAVLTLLAVLPWYLQVPANLARWRVAGGWLTGELTWPHALGQPFVLGAGLLSGTTDLGGWRSADRLAIGLFLLLLLWMARQGLLRRMFCRRALLVWGCVAAACVGPLIFDLLRHTTASDIPRYVLPGLPAAMLLAALGLSQLPPRTHVAVLAVLLLAWLPGTWAIVVASVPRPRQPYRELDARLESWARPGDVVLVRSIPSGVVGVARYLKRDIPLASWVGQLGSRQVPADLEQLLRGRRRAAVATIHDLGAPNPVEPWLETHARLLGRDTFPSSSAEVLYFGPATGETFFSGAPYASNGNDPGGGVF